MASSTLTAPLSSLTGVIERITFHSSESGYTVARLNTGNVKQLITIVGSFANLQAGQTLFISSTAKGRSAKLALRDRNCDHQSLSTGDRYFWHWLFNCR